MENGINPMSQLPQLLEALLSRLEATLAEYAHDPTRRAVTESLFHRLRKQASVMRAVASSVAGEGLTPEQAALVTQVPVPQMGIFPAWTNEKKESKESK